MLARTSLLLVLAVAGATPLVSQTDERPNRGKIDGVEREKDKDRGSGGGGGCDCGFIGWLDFAGEALGGAFFPRGVGRGYQPYPYAAPDSLPPFTVSRTERGRRYGTVSAAYFDDAGSTLNGGSFAFEGAASAAYIGFEVNTYAEPLATETDHLHSWRLGVGVLPRISHNGLMRLGFAVRSVILDDGTTSLGPELELGAQFFPRRPFGASVTGRIAAQEWSSGGSFTFQELNTTGAVFLGRVELQVGWHWAKLGSAPAFGGPTIGTRLWF